MQVIKIGRPAHDAYEELVGVYSKRLKPVWKIDEVFVKAQPSQERSGKEMFSRLGWSAQGQRQDSHQLVVVLDERGRSMSSPQFAQYLQGHFNQGIVKALSFVVGGPYGVSPEVRDGADLLWSLSPGVFPSDLAWLMLWEQLYRASTIIRGTSYHHE